MLGLIPPEVMEEIQAMPEQKRRTAEGVMGDTVRKVCKMSKLI